jgi:hypothetical protein
MLKDKTMEKILKQIRSMGYLVGVHNDYKLNGQSMTFWLFTHESGHFIKGEGLTDEEALKECKIKILEYSNSK